MLDLKKVVGKFHLVAKKDITTEEKLLILAIAFVFVIGYLVPVVLYPIPTGTDVYTHMFHADKIQEAGSLEGFYKICQRNGYTSCDYPFGLWLIGALFSSASGMTIFSMSYILPLIALLSVIVIFYFYSEIFIKKRNLRLLSVLFMLSMPNIAITALSYTPSVFSIILTLLIFYFTFTDKISLKIRVILLEVLILCLLATHTGTYLFILSFSMTFLIAMAIIWGDFKKEVFILLLSLLVLYTITMWSFPNIQQQYIDKSTLFLSIGNTFSDLTGLDIFRDLSSMFYQRVFVQKELIDAILWAALFYVVVETIILVRTEIVKIIPRGGHLASIPIIGSISDVSHSVISTPFWVGPMHSFLTIFGALRLNKKGLGILASCALVLLLPGGLNEGSTGALREIFYFIVIIPITSALGFEYLSEKLSKRKGQTRNVLFWSLFIVAFITFAVTAVFGNLYYRLEITGTDFEREGMTWLGTVGSPSEGVSGYGYRHMMSVYSGKVDPSASAISSGTETRRYINDIKNIYFAEDAEYASNDAHANFGVDYIIVSEKTIRNLRGNATDVKLTENRIFDKIYSSSRSFSIYRYTTLGGGSEEKAEVEQKISFIENLPLISDNGVDYEIEGKSYRIVMDKKKPVIKFIGSPDDTSLGEGGSLIDNLVLTWNGGEKADYTAHIDIEKLNYTYSTMSGNQLIYETTAGSEGEEWASIIFRYTFYENAIKKEALIINDRLANADETSLLGSFNTRVFSSMNYFTYTSDGVKKRKTVYPSDDSIKVEDLVEDVFINNGREGLYISYGTSSGYPERLIYKGSTLYNYSYVIVENRKYIKAGDYLHVTQYIALGNEEFVKSVVNEYSTVELSLYPHGKTPLVLTGYFDSILRASSDEFEYIISAFEELESEGVTQYTIGVPMNEYAPARLNRLTSLNKDIIEYEQMYDRSSRYYYNYNAQLGKISRAQSVLNEYKSTGSIVSMEGLIPEALDYNLDTIKVLNAKGVDFIIGTEARTPHLYLYRYGIRYPRYTYLDGNQTGVLLLPVSLPTSSSLRPEFNSNETLWSWMSSIDACTRSREMCLFLWHPESIGKTEYARIARKVIEYAKENGMSLLKSQDVSNHMAALSDISSSIERGVDTLTINVSNSGSSPVNYVGFTAILPSIDYKCPYNVTGAEEMEIRAYREDCMIRISVNIQARSKVQVKIRPSISRQKFNVTILEDMEGEVVISVNDTNGMPVEGAFVSLENDLHVTDIDGIAKMDAEGGIYDMKVYKAGYEVQGIKIEIGSRGFGGMERSSGAYVFYGVVLVLLFVVYFFRQMIIFHTFDKTGKVLRKVKNISAKVKKKVS